MSEPGAQPKAASRVMSALMLIFGIVLLLPGLCAGFFVVLAIGSPRDPYLTGLTPLWLICFAVAAGGIVLITWGLRRLRRG